MEETQEFDRRYCKNCGKPMPLKDKHGVNIYTGNTKRS